MPNGRSILIAGFFVAFSYFHSNLNAAETPLLLQSDSAKFSNFLRKATAGLDSAEYYFDKASEHIVDTFQVVTLARFWARHYYTQNNLEEAEKKVIEVVDRYALEDLSEEELIELSHCYVLYDFILKRRGEYELAVIQLTKAVNILEKIPSASAELADAYNSMGANYRRLQEYEKANDWFRRVLEKSSELKLVDMQIKAYGNLGLTHIDLYQTQKAQEYYHLILNIIDKEEIAHEDVFRYLSHNNLGLALQAELEFDSAVYHYNKSLLELEKMDESFNRDYSTGNAYANLGNLAYQKGSFEKSLGFTGNALTIFERLFGKDHILLVKILRILGNAHLAKGNIDSAKTSFFRALTISKANAKDEVTSYNSLGEFYCKTKEFEKAIAYYDSAIVKNQIKANGAISYVDDVWYFFSVQGKVEVELAKTAPNFERVLALYEELTTMLSSLLKDVENREVVDECSFVLEKIYLYFSQLHNSTQDKSLLNSVWEISEINKAVKLKGQLKNQYSLSFSLPDSLLKREQTLVDSINLVLLATEPNKFDSSLFALNRSYEQFIAELEETYPEYYELKNTLTVSTLQEVLDNLGEKDVVLNFFEGKENVFLLKVSSTNIENFQFNKTELNHLIDRSNEAIFDSKSDQLLRYSDKILTLLDLDVNSSDFENMLILPDGIVWKLNFSALAKETESGVKFLGNESTLSFGYYFDQKKESKKLSNGILAFSFNELDTAEHAVSYSNFRDLNQSIPGTSKEIISISNIWDGEYYFGDKATESEFKRKGEKHSILHLATHGYQNEKFPENSFLQFSSSDTINDGRLYSYEIYNLKLNADLAVLSACNSGKGKVITGEGMMSMAHAFAYAGVKSTLASRWEVPDVSAPFLIKYFYQGLKKGMRKSEALKYAQTEFLRNDADNITSNPFYWSGLYIIGNDDPTSEESSNTKWFALTLVIVLLLLFFFRRSRRVS